MPSAHRRAGVLHDDEITYSIVAGVARRAAPRRRRELPHAVRCARRGVPGARRSRRPHARPRGERGAGACYLHATARRPLPRRGEALRKRAGLERSELPPARVVRDLARCRAARRGCSVWARGRGGAWSARRARSSVRSGRRPAADELESAVLRGLARGLGARFENGTLGEAESRPPMSWPRFVPPRARLKVELIRVACTRSRCVDRLEVEAAVSRRLVQ